MLLLNGVVLVKGVIDHSKLYVTSQLKPRSRFKYYFTTIS